MRLAAGLCPDPLGKLERSPRPSSHNWGRVPTSNGEGREGNGKKEGRGWQGGKEEGEGKEGKGGPPSRIAKVQRWQPESVGVRQLCLRRIGVRGQKSLKTAAINNCGNIRL